MNKQCLLFFCECLLFNSVLCVCVMQVKAKFDRIQQMTRNKPYERHIVKHYYAVECGLEDGEDAEVRRDREGEGEGEGRERGEK